jgi:hypothetical protein
LVTHLNCWDVAPLSDGLFVDDAGRKRHVQCHASRYDRAGLSSNGEPNMPVLKSLSFTALPKSGYDPVQIRRDNFVAKLEEQKLLLKDPNHVRTVQRWTKVNGERQAVTKQQSVRPWWKTDASGQVVMSIKFRSKPVEFEKGRPASSSARRRSCHPSSIR